MIVSKNMQDLLGKIISKQPSYEDVLHDEDGVASPVVCCTLINLYIETQDLETRVLITEFMEQAGYPWLRKLVTRDPTPVSVVSVAA
ncbi:MAG: hypothetical protein HKN85_05605 [Gammaproteobacteria bacterium]|nr:hypothetical protein [Gammaproteobacteria bacterium]